MIKVRVKITAEGILPDHLASRLQGLTGKRDRKVLAQMIVEEAKDPQIEVEELKKI
jgi:hypothetical protein